MKELEYPFDSGYILRNKRSIKRALIGDGEERIDKRIAVLGGSTTHEIKEVLELFLLAQGIRPSFYESEYNMFWEDVMFDNPELKEFAPDLIFVHTTFRNIRYLPAISDGKEELDGKADAQYRHFEDMWEKAQGGYGCPVIQNNFERPYFRLLGNKDITDPHGYTNFVNRLNTAFYDYASAHPNLYINDIDYLAGRYGYGRWTDLMAWNMYKYAMNLDAIPEFAFNLSNIIKSIYGKNKKAFVLDLDNTLWGGAVGDVGAEGIQIGPETPVGQIYGEFQSYIKLHKDVGILLNISSKNEEKNALEGLANPANPLSADDFICTRINWGNKDRNIAEIIEELNIGQDSVVFVDDNPAERMIGAMGVPGLAAPEIGGVETYIDIIDRSGFFESPALSGEDLGRSELYKANRERAKLQSSFGSYEEYLLSLGMKAAIKDFDRLSLARVTQLTNKSNQFNLTTKRYTEAEMEALCKEPGYIRLYGRLEDRFGDNGIVSVVIGRQDGKALDIELWLMSCRVLKRDMECAMLDALVAECAGRGIETVRGYYFHTAKNAMVADFYGRMGFGLVSRDAQGNSAWQLCTAGYKNQNRVIGVNE